MLRPVIPPSLQLQSVLDAFGRQGWQCEVLEGREVVETAFEAHHTRVDLHAQVFAPLNALSVVGETPLTFEPSHLAAGLELLMRANKQLTLGGFEYDLDRRRMVFRITNLFEREKFDADIISSMVHCAIAELDRLAPLATHLNRTPAGGLAGLSLPLLLDRDDLLPPTPENMEDEQLYLEEEEL